MNWRILKKDLVRKKLMFEVENTDLYIIDLFDRICCKYLY